MTISDESNIRCIYATNALRIHAPAARGFIMLHPNIQSQTKFLPDGESTHTRPLDSRLDAFGAKGFVEGGIEFVTARKIFDAILVSFAEHLTLH